MRTSILLILVITGVCFAKPYEFDRSGAGVSIGYGILSNKAEFRELPGVRSCCPDSLKGTGDGWQISFYYDYKIVPDLFLGISLGYQYLEPSFEAVEDIFVMDMRSDNIIPGQFTHFINVYLSNFAIQPYISWSPFNRFKIGFAPYISWTLYNRYNQWEQITKPERRGSFLDSNGVNTGLRKRNEVNDKLPPKNEVFFGSEFFASYELPLNNENSLRLVPSFSFNLNFAKALNVFDWNTYRFSIGLRYDLTPPYDPAKDTIFPDSIIVPDTATQPLITELPKDTTDYGSVKDSLTDITDNLNNFEYDTTSITDIKVITDTLIKVDTIDLNSNNDINLSYSIIDFDGNRLPVGYEIPLMASEIKYPMHYVIYYDKYSNQIPERYINPNGYPYKNIFFGTYYDLIGNTGKYLKKKRNTSITLRESLSNNNISLGMPDTLRNLLTKNYKVNKNNILTESNIALHNDNTYQGGIALECKDSSFYNSLNPTEKKLAFDISAIEFIIDKLSSVKADKWRLKVKYGLEEIFTDSSVAGDKMTSTFNTSCLAIPLNRISGKLAYEFMLWDSAGKIYREEGWIKTKAVAGNSKLFKREYLREEDLRITFNPKKLNDIKKIVIVTKAIGQHDRDNDLTAGITEYMKKNYPGIEYQIYERNPIPADDKEKYYELKYFDELIEFRLYK